MIYGLKWLIVGGCFMEQLDALSDVGDTIAKNSDVAQAYPSNLAILSVGDACSSVNY